MKKIATLSILFTISFFVLGYGKTNAAQLCPSTTLSTQAEVAAYGCSEVQGELTISRNDIDNLDCPPPVRDVSARLIIRDKTVLLNLDGLSNFQSIDRRLSIKHNNKYHRYESYHPSKEELF